MCRICKRHNARGFTLVEIILVVAVIIILATALMTGVGDWINKANAANADAPAISSSVTVNEAVIQQSAEVEQQINDSENMLADYNF